VSEKDEAEQNRNKRHAQQSEETFLTDFSLSFSQKHPQAVMAPGETSLLDTPPANNLRPQMKRFLLYYLRSWVIIVYTEETRPIITQKSCPVAGLQRGMEVNETESLAGQTALC
jgi:hypothetical protein